MEIKTAILVDGGFYRKRANSIFGQLPPGERAEELAKYCLLHIKDATVCKDGARNLYRVFYYDCPPLDTNVFHPLTRKTVNLGKSETYKWSHGFFDALLKKRKFALRLGFLSPIGHGFRLNLDAVKKLCEGKVAVTDLTESDFALETTQKGVDMKIGIDIAHLAYKRLVDQIILISGDSDFVPAAKLARREGIDFILDPLGAHVSDDLIAHVDGVQSFWHDKRMCGRKTRE